MSDKTVPFVEKQNKAAVIQLHQPVKSKKRGRHTRRLFFWPFCPPKKFLWGYF
jgi:hypothetical protein